ncbi:MAG: hypothetical protein ABFR82_05630 [Nitrospirota bacterium]
MIKKANRTVLYVLLIVITGILAYSNTFHVPFIFDDKAVIVRNPIVKDLHYFVQPDDAENFKGFFEYEVFKRRYIGYLTFALNYKMQDLDVRGYHIVNLLIHITNSIILYFFIIVSFNTPFLKKSSIKGSARQIAFIAALFFVSHPIQTQAVTYIWQRVTSLTATFYLFSLLMYVKARLVHKAYQSPEDCLKKGLKSGSVLYYSASIVSAVLAMKTKEIAITLPISIFLYEIMFMEGTFRKRIFRLIPYFLAMMIIPLSLTNSAMPIGDLIGDISDRSRSELLQISRLDYLFTEFRVLITYIRLIFLPINQNLDYDYPLYSSFFDPSVFLSFLLLLLIFSLGVYCINRYRGKNAHARLISFGIFWFFITLSVESTFIPIRDVINEHRMYLPSIGIFTAICTIILMVTDRMRDRGRMIMAAMLAVIIIALTGATYARNMVWRNEINLWADVVSKSPGKARAFYNYGNAYKNRGDLINAGKKWEKTLELEPKFSPALNQMGNLALLSNSLYDARRYYRAAILSDIDNAEPHYNLAIVLEKLNEPDEAVKHYEIFLEKASTEYSHLIAKVKNKISAIKNRSE